MATLFGYEPPSFSLCCANGEYDVVGGVDEVGVCRSDGDASRELDRFTSV